VQTSITAWEFARGNFFNDPSCSAAVCGGMLRQGATLIDIGCGQGLMLALLAEVSATLVLAGGRELASLSSSG
jgi:2-polyprenyl-3-methyl-5-hydroxy-6-metoxy-1,4-benzoquinol methylase